MALQDDRKDNTDGHSDWEQNLPEFLQESIQAMVSAWDKLDRGEEYYLWDCDYFDMPAFHNRLHQELLEETYPKLVNAADHSPFKPYQVAAYHHIENGFDDKLDYTAVASYTGTATSKYATGYTVTADYKGDVTRTSCDTVVYTAVFSSVGNAAAKTGRSSFNWLWLLIPVGAAALGGCGYAGYKGYRHYINKTC